MPGEVVIPADFDGEDIWHAFRTHVLSRGTALPDWLDLPDAWRAAFDAIASELMRRAHS
jgi:hypothetical protein